MAQIIDLSKRLTNEKPRIIIDKEHNYEVRNNKNVAILIKEITEDDKIKDFAKDGDKYDKIIQAALGDEALSYLKTIELSVNGWNLVIEAIMAAINEISLDEIEGESKKEQDKKREDFRK